MAEYRQQAPGRHRRHQRQGDGEKTAPVVAIQSVADGDHLLLITEQGLLIRIAASDVRETGRAAQGVKLIDVAGGDRVVAVAKLAERDERERPHEPAPAEGEAPAGENG